jgi:hypothetical protein
MVRNEAVPVVGESTMRNGQGGCQETCFARPQKLISSARGIVTSQKFGRAFGNKLIAQMAHCGEADDGEGP